MHKKILIILTGKLKFFSKKNYLLFKNLFKGNVDFCITPWNNTNNKIIQKFKTIYKPIFIKKIIQKNFNNKVKKIKYPDPEGNPIGTLNMWNSIEKSFKEIYKYYKFKKKPDYIVRYRSDILPKNNIKFEFVEKINQRNIVIPDRYHWNGINDQIFIIKYSDIKLFFSLNNFINEFIKQERYFSSEYIFQQFLKFKKIKIIYSSFNYKIMRFRLNKKKKIKVESKIKLDDLVNCKINKLKYKIRNFKDHYIKKKYLNKNQDIFIK